MHVRLMAAVTGLALLPFVLACPHDLSRTIANRDSAPKDLGDAGPRDVGPEAWLDACVPSNGGVEICDGLDNDCNGAADDTFDLSKDPANCGKCGNVCVTPNATPACVAGVCAVGDCARDKDGNTTHWNTDGDWKTGCDYECSITSGGHEVCDSLDNNCDKQMNEKCKSLTLLYSFGDSWTYGYWPAVDNLAGTDGKGLATGGIKNPRNAGLRNGVKGEGGDGYAVALDGTDDQVLVTPTTYQTVFDCDDLAGWSAYGAKAELSSTEYKQGKAAIKVTGETDSQGRLLTFTGTARDLSQWKNKSFTLDGYLTFWVFIKDPSHSKPKIVTLGNKSSTQNAHWVWLDTHVLGPKKGAFSVGWNLVALPFSLATFTSPQLTDWSNMVFMQISTNVNYGKAADNDFIFDDIRVEKDLSQRFTHFTVMAWVKPEAVQSRVYVLHKKDDLPGLGTDPTGKRWWFTLGSKVNIEGGAGSVKAGAWTHLAMTYDGAVFSAYLNGKAVGSRTTSFTPGERISLGGNGATGRFFKGLIDEVAVYNRAMSPAELKRYFGFFTP